MNAAAAAADAVTIYNLPKKKCRQKKRKKVGEKVGNLIIDAVLARTIALDLTCVSLSLFLRVFVAGSAPL